MNRTCYNCSKILKPSENSHLKKCSGIDYIDARYNQLIHDYKKYDLSSENINKLYNSDGYSYITFKQTFGLAYRQTSFLLDYYKIPRKSSNTISKEKNEKFINTCLDKYGIKYASNDDIINKRKRTFLENFGVDNIFKDSEFKKRSLLKMKDKYGVYSATWINMSETERKDRINKLHYNLKKWWRDMDEFEKEKRISLLARNRQDWWDSLSEDDKYKFIHTKSYISNLEKRIHKILIDNNITYVAQYWINKHPYDIKIGNTIIEVNGDYWHCNPNLYNESYHHTLINKTAKEIWEYDLNKKINAEIYNYRVFYLWEEFINKSSDDDILTFIKSIID